MHLKDLPALERPREKAKYYGINRLNNSELLALIIGSGSKENNVLSVASSLLSKAGSIENILSFSLNDLLKINGIKEATAFRFLAINELIKRKGELSIEDSFIDSKALASRYQYLIGNNTQESMYLVGISKQGKFILEKELYKGTSCNLISSEKEIIKELELAKAKFFVLIHNHPSSNINPSNDDFLSTNRLKQKAQARNLYMLDSLIVSNNKYYSFKEKEQFLD